jgi:hypothetical protein
MSCLRYNQATSCLFCWRWLADFKFASIKQASVKQASFTILQPCNATEASQEELVLKCEMLRARTAELAGRLSLAYISAQQIFVKLQ